MRVFVVVLSCALFGQAPALKHDYDSSKVSIDDLIDDIEIPGLSTLDRMEVTEAVLSAQDPSTREEKLSNLVDHGYLTEILDEMKKTPQDAYLQATCCRNLFMLIDGAAAVGASPPMKRKRQAIAQGAVELSVKAMRNFQTMGLSVDDETVYEDCIGVVESFAEHLREENDHRFVKIKDAPEVIEKAHKDLEHKAVDPIVAKNFKMVAWFLTPEGYPKAGLARQEFVKSLVNTAKNDVMQISSEEGLEEISKGHKKIVPLDQLFR